MAVFQKQSQSRSKFKPQSVRIMDQVREVLRYHHYALRTKEAYVKQVLDLLIADDLAPVRSKKPVRLPVVMST